MNTKTKLTLLIGASTLALTACGGGDGGGYQLPPGGGGGVVIPGQGTLENMFGTGFGAIFRVGANGTVADPQDSDVISLSLTADAVPVP